jgi:hypothetical protein
MTYSYCNILKFFTFMKTTFKTFSVKLLTGMLVLTLTGAAHASLITLATGKSSAGAQTSANAYKSVVEAAVSNPSSGYGTTTLSSFNSVNNSGLFGSNGNIAFDYTIKFNVANNNAGIWGFRAGVDFGKGGAIFLDGVALGFKSNDMWWNGSYANTGGVFNYTSMMTAGNHTLSIYGLESCCDGKQQAQFHNSKNTAFTTFSAADGANPVPEPATLGLLGIGLLAAAGLRRKS